MRQAVGVEICQRRVLYRRRQEALQPLGRAAHAGGDVFEPGLVGRRLQALGRARAVVVDLALPAAVRELVIVPDADEWPQGARVLDVGIGQIGLIDMAIVGHGGGNLDGPDAGAGRQGADLAHRASLQGRLVLGRPDHLIDEVAQVQNETQPFGLGFACVLGDHAPIGRRVAQVDVLAADEGEAGGRGVVLVRGGEGAARAAGPAVGVDEAVPVGSPRFQPGDQRPAGPVGGF